MTTLAFCFIVPFILTIFQFFVSKFWKINKLFNHLPNTEITEIISILGKSQTENN